MKTYEIYRVKHINSNFEKKLIIFLINLKVIHQRCTKVSTLLNLLEYGNQQGLHEHDWSKTRMALEDLSSTLVNASKTELDVNFNTLIIC